MSDFFLQLDPARLHALQDLADAQGRTPEAVVEEAVCGYLRDERLTVRAVGERLAREHADLLRRLGE
ncbi:hypothetical protein [Streptomyces sp. NEAU-W12]|uniref:hypothetical protein n=1 Tax=Streptomyces sp. NEAU-W12 TaxID=2994668 RepID=UPI00224A820F|nr:hypothetical protein [Streptomyces sp. NEAU-W12]MCX2925198.1 hypothetical protein [Streptomyces sp. NEAU-W12]